MTKDKTKKFQFDTPGKLAKKRLQDVQHNRSEFVALETSGLHAKNRLKSIVEQVNKQ